ncbi:MAG: hypothetical protein MZV49_24255 [Rhodopseudomonas palustris]|nr:hypothetical protein [Rhodopseudomonas palustris]
MTVSGTYTGNRTRTFRILVQTGNVGGGVKDPIQWSDDNGTTYSAKWACTSTLYIGYGLTLTFATTTTGHTTNDYWTFTCRVCSGAPTMQDCVLTTLPVSSDPQVTARKIYRTTRNGTTFYYFAPINDNDDHDHD